MKTAEKTIAQIFEEFLADQKPRISHKTYEGISPADSGIYLDDHVQSYARIARFLKQYGAVPGIQLAHAGRKASVGKPWEGGSHIDDRAGGWEVIAPSAVAFGGKLLKVPREMTVQDIRKVQEAFVAAAK